MTNVPRRALAAAIHYIVFIQRDARHTAGRRVAELVEVAGLRPDGSYDVRPVPLEAEPPSLAVAA